MVSQKILNKVRWVYRQKETKTHSGGRVCEYHYWYGYWKENGKSRAVWLGKELPESLQHLYDGKKLGPKGLVYFWPGHGRRGQPLPKKAGHHGPAPMAAA
ncbi:hypothetical protein ES705_27940 [subsurface metagenome]